MRSHRSAWVFVLLVFALVRVRGGRPGPTGPSGCSRDPRARRDLPGRRAHRTAGARRKSRMGVPGCGTLPAPAGVGTRVVINSGHQRRWWCGGSLPLAAGTSQNNPPRWPATSARWGEPCGSPSATGTPAATTTFCGLVFADGGFRAVMSRGPTGVGGGPSWWSTEGWRGAGSASRRGPAPPPSPSCIPGALGHIFSDRPGGSVSGSGMSAPSIWSFHELLPSLCPGPWPPPHCSSSPAGSGGGAARTTAPVATHPPPVSPPPAPESWGRWKSPVSRPSRRTGLVAYTVNRVN